MVDNVTPFPERNQLASNIDVTRSEAQPHPQHIEMSKTVLLGIESGLRENGYVLSLVGSPFQHVIACLLTQQFRAGAEAAYARIDEDIHNAISGEVNQRLEGFILNTIKDAFMAVYEAEGWPPAPISSNDDKEPA